MSAVSIYVLIDPRDGQMRYVGQTSCSLARRLSGHVHQSKDRRTHRDCWIFGLIEQGLRPEIRLIETCSDDWPERERFWIEELRNRGCDLTNRTIGGEGTPGCSPSEKCRLMSSERQRNRMSDPEVRAALAEKVSASWTPERRAAKRAEMLSRMTAEVRAAKAALQRQPEVLAAQRAAQSRYWTDERRALRSEQVRASQATRKKAVWTDEMRQAAAEHARRRHAVERCQKDSQ